jgi:site-specific recombinase XerD
MPLPTYGSVHTFVVEIIRKSTLPTPEEVIPRLREAPAAAHFIKLREPRPAGFPLLFAADFELIEPALAYLHEHAIRRAHTSDTLNTYMEVLYDWFDALEQSGIQWNGADAADLVAYRNRMLREPSAHTGRPYGVRTINHRVRGVLRFYEWMIRNGWLSSSELVGRGNDFAIARRTRPRARRDHTATDADLFVLRQFETLPRPLTSGQLRELLAQLPPPYDLMARWQLYTGLRVGELLGLTVSDILKHGSARRSSTPPPHHVVQVLRKGRKSGYVIAAESLLQETTGYLSEHRSAWINRTARKRHAADRGELFIKQLGQTGQEEQLPASNRRYREDLRLSRNHAPIAFDLRLHDVGKAGAARQTRRGDQPATDRQDPHGTQANRDNGSIFARDRGRHSGFD